MSNDAFEKSIRDLPTAELVYALTVLLAERDRRLLAIFGEPAPSAPAEPPRIPALDRARAFEADLKKRREQS